jgi:hypothetical protein
VTGPARIAYWTCALAAAGVLLVAVNAVAATGVFGLTNGRAAKAKPTPWRINNSRMGKTVINVSGVYPGKQGTGRVVLNHTGTKPIKRIALTQDQVKLGGMSPALQLQVFDFTAKRCLYPRPVLPKPKRGAKPKPEPRVCATWKPFTAGRALQNMVVPPLQGTTWKPKEKHAIDVRWRLLPTSPPSDQGKSASFRLVWRASA